MYATEFNSTISFKCLIEKPKNPIEILLFWNSNHIQIDVSFSTREWENVLSRGHCLRQSLGISSTCLKSKYVRDICIQPQKYAIKSNKQSFEEEEEEKKLQVKRGNILTLSADSLSNKLLCWVLKQMRQIVNEIFKAFQCALYLLIHACLLRHYIISSKLQWVALLVSHTTQPWPQMLV